MSTLWKPALESTEQPLYLAIAEAVADDIQQGRLSDGARMPTQRELADELKVAIGTVTRAYAEAERRGLIRGDGRRGTFVGPPQTSRAYLSAIAGKKPQGIDLSKNHPSHPLDPDLQSALRRLARGRSTQELLEYPPAPGLSRHREAGARWFTSLGAKVDPESVFVTAGAQHALSVILAAETEYGDTIAAERFTYPGIRAAADQVGVHVAGVASDNEGMLPDALEALCRLKSVRLLYCNPSLSNPTNTIYPKTRRMEIARVAEKYGLAIIEDEIMRPMLTDHPGFITNLLPHQSFLIISASKVIAAGLRVGFILTPPKTRQRLVESLNASCLGMPPLTAELLSTWLDDGTAERVIARRRTDAAARQKLASRLLAGLKFHNHPASYHVWLELPEGWNGMKFAMEAQLRGVVVTPAEAFATDDKHRLDAVRLSLAGPPSLEILRNGLGTLIDMLGGASGHNLATV